jgi:hypothetical protein
MRTTVTLDPDVERVLRNEIHRSNKSFKEVLNSAIRSALRPRVHTLPELLPPCSMGLRRGIDPRELAELSDELEAEAFLKTAAKQHRTQ